MPLRHPRLKALPRPCDGARLLAPVPGNSIAAAGDPLRKLPARPKSGLLAYQGGPGGLRSKSQKQTTTPAKAMTRTTTATHIDHVMGDKKLQLRGRLEARSR